MSRILNFLVIKLKFMVKPIYFKFASYNYECNICSWRDNRFEGDSWHLNIICPRCRSQIRQRLFWAAINHLENVNIKKVIKYKKVIHFAPDKNLVKSISSVAKEYITADLLLDGYSYQNIDLNIDLSDMEQIKDQEFDCLIAFDVLEHVPKHLKAIEESNRILKLGGYCIFTIPQKDNLDTTYEDLSIINSKEREAKFGQWDHLRIYGNDFKQMIEERGFDVIEISADEFDSQLVKKNILFPPLLSKHPLATNYRRIYFGRKNAHI